MKIEKSNKYKESRTNLYEHKVYCIDKQINIEL